MYEKDLNFTYRNQTYFNGNISNNEDKCVNYLKKLKKDTNEKIEINKKIKKLKESGNINDLKQLDLNLEKNNEIKEKTINNNISIETSRYEKKKI